jgi:ABC-type glycerol-3-phosphate transport system permease component
VCGRTNRLAFRERHIAGAAARWGILFAASVIQLAPVLLFVVFMNRYLVAGLTAGATKG